MSLPLFTRSSNPNLLVSHVPQRFNSFFCRSKERDLSKRFNIPPSSLIARLDNGIRVTSEPTSGKLAQISVRVESGSRHQEKDNGLAYLTKQILTRGLVQGQTLSAYTNRDHTSYNLTCLKEDVPQFLPLLGSLFLPENQIKEDVFSECQNLLESQRQKASHNIEQILFDHLHSIAYQGSSLGYSVLGNSNVTSLDEVIQFRNKNYTGPRILVSGVGIDSHEQFVDGVKKSFAALPNSFAKSVPNTRYVGSLVDIRDDFLPKVHIMYAVEVSATSLSTQIALQILQAALGNWDISHGTKSNTVSRLGETIALEHLGDRAQSFLIPYNNTGLLGIYGIADAENLEDFSVEVLSEFVRVSQKLSHAEIMRAKTTVWGAITRQLSTTSGLLDNINHQTWSFGPRYGLPAIAVALASLTDSEIRGFADSLLYDVDPVIAAIGPTTHLPDYNRMRSWMYWNRF